jgi:hypothetical protein
MLISTRNSPSNKGGHTSEKCLWANPVLPSGCQPGVYQHEISARNYLMTYFSRLLMDIQERTLAVLSNQKVVFDDGSLNRIPVVSTIHRPGVSIGWWVDVTLQYVGDLEFDARNRRGRHDVERYSRKSKSHRHHKNEIAE